MRQRVFLGMSGGVDSSAAACILLDQGYEVIGVSARMWGDGRYEASGLSDARLVADILGIPYYELDVRDEFKKYVTDYFVSEYVNGRTPNPCNACNRFVKWESLMRQAREIGAECIATGHYARMGIHPETGRQCICRSAARDKDQSYALYALTQEQLAATLFPMGPYSKEDARAVAEAHKLPVARKPDSQDICFIPDGDYARFISRYTGIEQAEGNFLDESGRVLGRHKGVVNYTVGQRKGLGLAFGKPMYVKRISASDNTVTLSEDTRSPEMSVRDVNWMAFGPFDGWKRLSVKIRYNHKAVSCAAYNTQSEGGAYIRCLFDEPQKAVTPGQSAVFYDNGYVAFGGIIE